MNLFAVRFELKYFLFDGAELLNPEEAFNLSTLLETCSLFWCIKADKCGTYLARALLEASMPMELQ